MFKHQQAACHDQIELVWFHGFQVKSLLCNLTNLVHGECFFGLIWCIDAQFRFAKILRGLD